MRHGGLRLPARTRIARLLQAAGARGVLPTVHTDGLWYLDRAFTRPWKYPEDLEKQVEGVLDPSGFPVPVQYGPNQILNGSFDTNLANWTNLDTAPSATTWSSGAALFTVATTGAARLRQQRPTVVGKKYRVSWRVAQITGTPTLSLALGVTVNGDGVYGATACPSVGWYSATITATSTLLGLAFIAQNAAGGTALVDDVTVQEVIEDWSWLGPNLVSIDNSWTTAGSATVSSGSVALSAAVNGAGAYKNYSASLGVGKAYLVVVTVTGYTSGAVTAWLGAQQSSSSNASVSSATSVAFVISPASNWNGNVFVGASTANTTATATITVREIIGNPLISPASGAGVTPTARVNLASWTEFEGGLNATTAPTRGGLIAAASMAGYRGAVSFGHDGSTSSFAYKTITIQASTAYRVSVDVMMGDGAPPNIGSTITGAGADFALLVGGQPAVGTPQIRHLGGNVYRASILVTSAASPVNTSNGVVKYNTNSPRTFTVTAYDVRLAIYGTSAYPDYQRVNDGTPGVFDYDHVGFPVRLEAQANGRGLRSAGTVNFTNTDALHAGMVVVKTSDASTAALMELSSTVFGNAGSCWFASPDTNGATNVQFRAGGSVRNPTNQTISAPAVMALLGSSKIPTDQMSFTVNAATSTSAGDQGTGNYGDHVLNISGRDLSGTPSLRFTGGMFGTPFIVDANVVSAADAAEMLRDIARVAGHTY